MATTPTNTFLNIGVEPMYPGFDAKTVDVQLDVSTVFPRGTIMGEIQANDIYSIATGSQGSGTFTLSFGGQTTTPLARNAAAAAVQTAFRALSTVGTANATVSLASGTPGTDGVYTLTLVGALGTRKNTAVTADFTLLATPGNASITHATTGAGGVYKAYADNANDGSQVAKGILQFDCATDASGNITLGTASGGGPYQQTQTYAPMWISGDFSITDLTGLDAAAVTDLGRMVEGTYNTVGTLRLT